MNCLEFAKDCLEKAVYHKGMPTAEHLLAAAEIALRIAELEAQIEAVEYTEAVWAPSNKHD